MKELAGIGIDERIVFHIETHLVILVACRVVGGE
jgi:hypothetical protein